MAKPNPIDQTQLAIAALTACIVQSIDGQDAGFRARFERNLDITYKEIRDMELSHIGALETLKWTTEFLKNL